MGISCGASLIKCILFIFNILWLVLGGVILWLGFTVTSYSGDLKEVWTSNLNTGAIVVLVAGFVIFFIAFLGCCGAIKENSCMLSTYAGIILILVVLECVGAYFALKYKTDFAKEINGAIEKKFDVFKGDKDVSRVVQGIQETFKCCGTTGSDFYKNKGYDPLASCCGDSWKDDTLKTCSFGDVKYKEGCSSRVKDTITTYLGGIGGVAIGLALFQLLIIVSACCLAREVRS